jgi:hypothetical protein
MAVACAFSAQHIVAEASNVHLERRWGVLLSNPNRCLCRDGLRATVLLGLDDAYGSPGSPRLLDDADDVKAARWRAGHLQLVSDDSLHPGLKTASTFCCSSCWRPGSSRYAPNVGS